MSEQSEIGQLREAGEPEPAYGVAESFVRACEAALLEGRYDEVDALTAPLHASDFADLVEELGSEARSLLVGHVKDRLDPETLTYLDEVVREDILGQLAPEKVAAAITELATDDAIDVFEDVSEEHQARVLDSLSPSDRALLEEALSYPEDSAGRLMQRELVTVPKDWSVGNTIDYMRERATNLPRDFYDIYIVDEDRRPVGAVPLSRLMRNQRGVRIDDIMSADLRIARVDMDQEEVALMFSQYGLVSAPAVDAEGRLVGVITADDVVHVIHEEAEEDIMRLGGVSGDDFYAAVLDTTRARSSWLLVNLATAFVAAAVIGLFDATIEKVVALAVLMPIVASMGGNVGHQALTVAVRALAMKELTAANAARIVGKEVLVGGINGTIFAILVGLISWAWFGNEIIGVVIAAAMVINLVVGGLAGVTIPLLLQRMNVDPAVGSSVILTTVTDVVGFLSFLGLATLVLL